MAARKAVEMLDPRPVKTQKAAVIFDTDVAYAVLGGILGAVNGESVLQGASFLGKRLGQKIASDLVTLVDDGTRPEGPGQRAVRRRGRSRPRRGSSWTRASSRDSCTTPSSPNGRASRSTGNASRGGFTSLPGIGPHNFYMAAGTVEARGHHQGHDPGPPAHRGHRLRHQPRQRELQRRSRGLLDRGREDRLPGQGPDHRGLGRRDARRHRHGRRRPRPRPRPDGADLPRRADADRRRMTGRPRPIHSRPDRHRKPESEPRGSSGISRTGIDGSRVI